jgi:hypothetical protein
LDSQPAEIQPDLLLAFCQGVISRHSEHWPPDENVLAKEFVTFFDVDALANFKSLCQLCTKLHIDVSVQTMPEELRGHNYTYKDIRAIAISDHHTFPGADEHTMLHELREIMERVFVGLGYSTDNKEDELEMQAEHFAALVRAEAFQRSLPSFIENARKIDSKLWRIGAYLFIGVMAFFYVSGCFFLPQFEDASATYKSLQRNVRT